MKEWLLHKKSSKGFIGRSLIKFVGVNAFINAVTIKSNNLDDFKYVNVYTNENGSNWLIGFEFTNNPIEDSFKLSHTKTQTSRVVSMSGILKKLNIDYKKIQDKHFEVKREKVGNKIFYIIEVGK